MYKKNILIILLILLYTGLYSQCNIKLWSRDNNYFISNTKENIYQDIDYTGGLTSNIQFSYVIRKDGNLDRLLLIEVLSIGAKRIISPSRLILNFYEIETIEVYATHTDGPSYDNELFSDAGYFKLTGDEVDKIKKNTISSIVIIDTETSKRIICKPPNKLLSRQLNCATEDLLGVLEEINRQKLNQRKEE